MRHQSLVLPGVEPVESDVDSIGFPKGWKNHSRISESPAVEMARLIREIGGKASAGETDEQLRARAARRLGISASRAKVLWYAETDNVRADEMDRARALAESTPIEEAINVLRAAKLRIDRKLEKLLDEVVSGVPNDSVDRRRLADRRSNPVPVRHRVARSPRLITAK
jgi:Arc/MetJ family transcription regulator